MDRRFQVFVSSTFADLQDERRTVIQTLMEMDCIPAGMELFPAADEEQWQFIKRVIDDCDYYLLIIGGRYGSLTPEGISYTEMEYAYAVECGLKVIALVHGNPTDLSLGKSETSPDARRKLEEFREKVKTGRLVRFWTNPAELPGLVALSLSKTIKMYPAVGWVRANTVSNTNLLEEINTLRKRNEELQREVAELQVARSRSRVVDAPLAQLYEALKRDKITIPSSMSGHQKDVKKPLLQMLLGLAEFLAQGVNSNTKGDEAKILYQVASKLLTYGLVEHVRLPSGYTYKQLRLSKDGVVFLNYARGRLANEQMHTHEESVPASANVEPSRSTSAGLASGRDQATEDAVRIPRKRARAKRPTAD